MNRVFLIAWIGAQFSWPKMPLRPKLSLGEVALQAFTLTPVGTFAFFLSVEASLQANSRDVVVNYVFYDFVGPLGGGTFPASACVNHPPD